MEQRHTVDHVQWFGENIIEYKLKMKLGLWPFDQVCNPATAINLLPSVYFDFLSRLLLVVPHQIDI